MPNRLLDHCPTCTRPFDERTIRNMGLRYGRLLNSMCPGRNGPSDIDHVLHNGHISPQRIQFLEYKNGVELKEGQRILSEALTGNWQRDDGRLLSVKHRVLQLHEPHPEPLLREVVDWLWP